MEHKDDIVINHGNDVTIEDSNQLYPLLIEENSNIDLNHHQTSHITHEIDELIHVEKKWLDKYSASNWKDIKRRVMKFKHIANKKIWLDQGISAFKFLDNYDVRKQAMYLDEHHIQDRLIIKIAHEFINEVVMDELVKDIVNEMMKSSKEAWELISHSFIKSIGNISEGNSRFWKVSGRETMLRGLLTDLYPRGEQVTNPNPINQSSSSTSSIISITSQPPSPRAKFHQVRISQSHHHHHSNGNKLKVQNKVHLSKPLQVRIVPKTQINIAIIPKSYHFNEVDYNTSSSDDEESITVHNNNNNNTSDNSIKTNYNINSDDNNNNSNNINNSNNNNAFIIESSHWEGISLQMSLEAPIFCPSEFGLPTTTKLFMHYSHKPCQNTVKSNQRAVTKGCSVLIYGTSLGRLMIWTIPWSGKSAVFVAQSPPVSDKKKTSKESSLSAAAICDIKTGTAGINQLISINKSGVVQIWHLNNAIDSRSVNGIKKQDKKTNRINMLQSINNVFEIGYYDMIKSYPSNSNVVIHETMDLDTVVDDNISATISVTDKFEQKKPVFGLSKLFGLKETAALATSNHGKGNKHDQNIAEDLTKFPSDTAICFHPSITLLGKNPSFLVGTCGGDIIKFNMDFMSGSTGMDAPIVYPVTKAFVDYEYLHPSNLVPKGFVLSGKPEEKKGNKVSREIFHFHKDKIILLEVLDNLSDTLISMDQSGKVAIWKYNPDCFEAKNWFRPITTITLLLQTQEWIPKSIDDDNGDDDGVVVVSTSNANTEMIPIALLPSMKVQQRLREKEVVKTCDDHGKEMIQTIYHPIYSKKHCSWIQYISYKDIAISNEVTNKLESISIDNPNEIVSLDNNNNEVSFDDKGIIALDNCDDISDMLFPVQSADIILEKENSINTNNTENNNNTQSHDVLQNNIEHPCVDDPVQVLIIESDVKESAVAVHESNRILNAANIEENDLNDKYTIVNSLNNSKSVESIAPSTDYIANNLSQLNIDTVFNRIFQSHSMVKYSVNEFTANNSSEKSLNEFTANNSSEKSLNEFTANNSSEKSLKLSDSAARMLNKTISTEDILNPISESQAEPFNRTKINDRNSTINNDSTMMDSKSINEVDDVLVDSFIKAPPTDALIDSITECDHIPGTKVATWSAIELNKLDLNMTIVTNKLSSDGSELFLLLAARYSENGHQVYNRTTRKEFSMIYYLMSYHVAKQQFHRPYPRLIFDNCKLDSQGSVNIILDFAVGPISHETLTRMAFILTIYTVEVYSLHTGKRLYMFDWRTDISSFSPTKISVCASQRVLSLSADDDVRVAVWIIHHKLDGLDNTTLYRKEEVVDTDAPINKLDNLTLESRFELIHKKDGLISLDYIKNRTVKTILETPVLEIPIHIVELKEDMQFIMDHLWMRFIQRIDGVNLMKHRASLVQSNDKLGVIEPTYWPMDEYIFPEYDFDAELMLASSAQEKSVAEDVYKDLVYDNSIYKVLNASNNGLEDMKNNDSKPIKSNPLNEFVPLIDGITDDVVPIEKQDVTNKVFSKIKKNREIHKSIILDENVAKQKLKAKAATKLQKLIKLSRTATSTNNTSTSTDVLGSDNTSTMTSSKLPASNAETMRSYKVDDDKSDTFI